MSKCALIGKLFGVRESEGAGVLREEVLQGLECVRESSPKPGSVHIAQLNCWNSVAPTGLQVWFRAFPGFRPHPPRRAQTTSWAIIVRSLRELLPRRGVKVAGSHADTERPLLPPRIQNRIGLFHSLADQHRGWTTDTKLAVHVWPRYLFALIFMLFTIPAGATDAPRSFSLSTSRTFAPGESVKIQLLARNVPELEFRVYKIRDAQKFFAGLKDLHSFGVQSQSPGEQIDQRTLLERLHDFKAHLWWLMRHFFRGQFTDEARDNFREQQGKLGKKSRVVGAAQFAQVPILNASQLVARWKLETPPALVSDTQQLPIDGLGAGVYLIEATDGTYKAYTVAMVTKIAMVERIENGQVALYVADRDDRRAGGEGRCGAVGRRKTCSRRVRRMAMDWLRCDGRACSAVKGAEPENVWILARHGDDAALVTPWSYNFGQQNRATGAGLYLHGPACLPAGAYGAYQGHCSQGSEGRARSAGGADAHAARNGAGTRSVQGGLTVSAHGTVTADLILHADAALGYYSIDFNDDSGGGQRQLLCGGVQEARIPGDGESAGGACAAGQTDSGDY